MLVVISPAKKLDMNPAESHAPTHPAFQDHAQELAAVARGLSHDDIRGLMGLSDSLAQLNVERFASFGSQARKPAVLSFAGDTYQGLEAQTLDTDSMAWAQDHLRILSGLYGLLRPLDATEPYRLEMGSKLKTAHGNSLYDYWGAQLSQALSEQAAATGSRVLVNCASKEYFGAVNPSALSLPVITPVFMEQKDGRAKIVSFFAKKARGAMARYIVQNRLQDPADLLRFDIGGYRYQVGESTADAPVFIRDYPAA